MSDVYRNAAAHILYVLPDQVTQAQRDAMKRAFYMLAYSNQPDLLARIDTAEGLLKEALGFLDPAGLTVDILEQEDQLKAFLEEIDKRQVDWSRRTRKLLGMEET
jgi:hypothetical protein